MAVKNNQGGCIMLFMGLIFTAVGFGVVYWGAQEEHFNCYRSYDICTMEKKKIFSDKKEKKFELDLFAIKKAVVKSHDSDDGVMYKLYLVTDENKIPLSDMSTSNYSLHREKADKVNSYLNSYEEKLEVIDKNTVLKIFGGVFFGAGLLMLLGTMANLFKMVIAFLFFITSKR